MVENRAMQSEAEKPMEDPFWALLVQQWANIERMYELLADKRPVDPAKIEEDVTKP